MKSAKYFAALAGGALLACAAAFAGPTNKKPLHLYETVVIGGKQLAPGDYQIQWSDSGSDAQVNILRGKDTVATFTAREVPVTADTKEGYSTQTAQDGSKTLTQVFFSGKKYGLDLRGGAAEGGAQTAGSAPQN